MPWERPRENTDIVNLTKWCLNIPFLQQKAFKDGLPELFPTPFDVIFLKWATCLILSRRCPFQTDSTVHLASSSHCQKVTQKHQITASVVFEKVWQQPQEGCPLGLSRTASWGFNDWNLPATHRPVFLFVCSYFVSLFHGKKTSEWFPNNGRKILCARGN